MDIGIGKVVYSERRNRFEEKFGERSDCKILQECWKEIRKEGGKHVWNERDKYYEGKGNACCNNPNLPPNIAHAHSEPKKTAQIQMNNLANDRERLARLEPTLCYVNMAAGGSDL